MEGPKFETNIDKDSEREQDRLEAEAAIGLLKKLKEAKRGSISSEPVDVTGLSPENAEDIRDAEMGLGLLEMMKKNKSESEVKKFCGKCGAKVTESSKFCGECGNKL